MKAILLRIWYRAVFPILNFIPSVVHASYSDTSDGKRILQSLRAASMKSGTTSAAIREVLVLMDVHGLKMNDDPIGGLFSFRHRPVVTCARRTGNCEDFACLWAAVMRHPRGKYWFLLVRSVGGSSHMMLAYCMGGVCWLLSGPKVLHDEFESKKERLASVYFKDETAEAIFY